MGHSLIEGPLLGNILVIVVAGAIAIGCFILMFVLLFRPGEKDERHPKYRVLRDDR